MERFVVAVVVAASALFSWFGWWWWWCLLDRDFAVLAHLKLFMLL